VEDGVALVRQAQQAHRHVGIIGVSLGTGVATQVAVQARPDRLLLVTPYDRMDLVAQDYLPNWPVKWLVSDTYDSAGAAAKLGDLPVAFLQADDDEIIAADRTRALAAALPRPPSPWLHVDSTHNGIWKMPELCSFVRQGG
jgi:dienelactone hydrolase